MSIIYCDECKHEFQSDSVILREEEFEYKNEKLHVSFFTCPKCNKIYVIQIMDERYYELREDIEKTKKRIRRNHGSNNVEFARTLQSMVATKANRLKVYCERTMDKFKTGTFTFVVSENNSKEQTIKYLP